MRVMRKKRSFRASVLLLALIQLIGAAMMVNNACYSYGSIEDGGESDPAYLTLEKRVDGQVPEGLQELSYTFLITYKDYEGNPGEKTVTLKAGESEQVLLPQGCTLQIWEEPSALSTPSALWHNVEEFERLSKVRYYFEYVPCDPGRPVTFTLDLSRLEPGEQAGPYGLVYRWGDKEMNYLSEDAQEVSFDTSTITLMPPENAKFCYFKTVIPEAESAGTPTTLCGSYSEIGRASCRERV